MAYLVIEWLKNGGKVLKPPQLEALGSTKVIAPNGREEGKPVMMQFKNSLWEGKIISLHEKMSAAKQAVNTGCRTPEGAQRTEMATESESPESGNNDTTKKSRARKKKSLGPDFASSWPEDINYESDNFETLEEKEMSASSSSAECAETDEEDMVTAVKEPKAKKRRKQNERKESVTPVNDSGSKKKGKRKTGESSKKKILKGKQQLSKRFAKEQRLQIVAAQSQQVKEMVSIDLCNEAPPSDKRVPEGCKNLSCAAEKEKLREEIKALKQNLADYAASTEISEPGAGSQNTQSEEPLRYGKVPRQAALNRKWEEIGNGVWICPLRVRAAQKEAKSKTAFARILLMHFYKKEELKGKRLGELDQDIVHAIAEFAVVAKLANPKPAEAGHNDPKGRKEKKPPAENKAAILQSLRTKMNNLLQEDEQKRKRQEKRSSMTAKNCKQSKDVVESSSAESILI